MNTEDFFIVNRRLSQVYLILDLTKPQLIKYSHMGKGYNPTMFIPYTNIRYESKVREHEDPLIHITKNIHEIRKERLTARLLLDLPTAHYEDIMIMYSKLLQKSSNTIVQVKAPFSDFIKKANYKSLFSGE